MARMSRIVEPLKVYELSLHSLESTARDRSSISLVQPDAVQLSLFLEAEVHEVGARKKNVLLERLEDDRYFTWLLMKSDGQYAGWCSASVGHGPNSRIYYTLRMEKDEAFFFDDVVLSRFRRQGIHKAAVYARLDWARSTGMSKALTIISDTNKASIATYNRAGFHPRGRLLFVPALRRTFKVPST